MNMRYAMMRPRRRSGIALLAILVVLLIGIGGSACGHTMSIAWSDNRYSSHVPEPESGKATIIDEIDHGCMAKVSWTMNEAKDYARLLKAHGYNRHIATRQIAGVYTWSAENGSMKVAISSFPDNTGVININTLR